MTPLIHDFGKSILFYHFKIIGNVFFFFVEREKKEKNTCLFVDDNVAGEKSSFDLTVDVLSFALLLSNVLYRVLFGFVESLVQVNNFIRLSHFVIEWLFIYKKQDLSFQLLIHLTIECT